MRSKNWIQVICSGLLLYGGAAVAQSAEQQPAPQPKQTDRAQATDQEFLNRALRANALELKLGRLASERGSSPDVKTKGKNMVQKHTDFGRELNEQARRVGLTETPPPTPAQDAVIARLSKLSGPEFDTAFAQTIDGIHQQELAMYKEEASRTSDPQLRAFAQKRVDTLQAMRAQPKPEAQPAPTPTPKPEAKGY